MMEALKPDNRRVDDTHLVAKGQHIWVSTVFLAIDHNFSGEGDPILFETMIFRNGQGEDMWRWTTWDKAKAGHQWVLQEFFPGALPLVKTVSSPLTGYWKHKRRQKRKRQRSRRKR